MIMSFHKIRAMKNPMILIRYLMTLRIFEVHHQLLTKYKSNFEILNLVENRSYMAIFLAILTVFKRANGGLYVSFGDFTCRETQNTFYIACEY